jgi:hypothetical protein
MTAPSPPKSLGINPEPCTQQQVNGNFQNIINEFVTNRSGTRPIRFRLTANLDTGSNAAAVRLTYDGANYVAGNAIQVFDFQGLSPTGSAGRGMFQAASGAEGWAVRREVPVVAGREEYEVVWMEQYAWAIEFTLTSTFTAGVATATVDASWMQGISPGATVSVHDDQGNFTSAAVGDKGTALRTEYATPTAPAVPYYKVVFLPTAGSGGSGTGVARFALTASLTTGSNASAVIRTWNGAAYVDGDAITVHDWYGTSGGGRGMWHAATGAEGWASRREGSATDYDILWMEQYADAIEFTLTSAFSGGIASATVDESWGQGIAPGATLNVHDDNDNFINAAIGDKGTALRSEYASPGTPATPYYKVVYLPPAASANPQPIRFKLTADLNTGGTAGAVVRTWNGAAFVDGGGITVRDWWCLANGVRGMFQGVTGMEGWARRAEGNVDTYDIIEMIQYARSIEYSMTSDWNLTTKEATALVISSWDQGIDPGASVTIHDDTATFTDAIDGCVGYAVRSEHADPNTPTDPYYKTVRSQRAANRASAVLIYELCGNAPEIDPSTWAIEPTLEGTYDVDPPAVLGNEAGHQALEGDIVYCRRINKQKPFEWEVDSCTLHDAQHISDVYWDGVCIRKKFFEHAAIETCSIEDDATVVCTVDCPEEQ